MTLSTWILCIWAFIVIQRIAELIVARRNETKVRAMGAQESGAEHYPALVVLHVLWLVAWPAEALYLGQAPMAVIGQVALGLALATQALRYWALASLGVYWNTRILVVPGATIVQRGPYRWLRHPNYIAVVLEISAVPLIFGAVWTATIFGIVNLWILLRIRIPAEERALRSIARPEESPESR